MIKKKLVVISVVFVAYCVLLVFISINYKNTTRVSTSDAKQINIVDVKTDTTDIDLLSPAAYEAATKEGKINADTPWNSNIELLGSDYPEQGLFMMPGTAIIYSVKIPTKMILAAKNYDAVAAQGISDGIILVIDVVQDGNSIKTYDPVFIKGDGQMNKSEFDLSEWQGKNMQLKIRCYDGGKDDAVGDWCIIKTLDLKEN